MRRYLTMACLALALVVSLAAWPATARAQYYTTYYPAPPVVSYYTPAPVVSYYAPVVTRSYYAAPLPYSYSFYTPTYAYYPAPTVSYYAPTAGVYTSYYGAPAVSTTTYVRPGLFRPRVYATTNYY